MDNLKNTQYFKGLKENQTEVGEVLKHVYAALNKKGYDPVSQLVGYIMSGDPTYITSYDNARGVIRRVERDEILEEILKNYIEVKLKG